MRGQARALAVALLLLAVHPAGGHAQLLSNSELSRQIWLDYNPSWALSDRVQLYGDVGYRSELESRGWWRAVLRPSVRYQWNPRIRFSGGIGFFYTANEVIQDRVEIRPWQGVSLDWPTRRIRLQHFVRLEQQFETTQSSSRSRTALRLRYRLRPTLDWNREGASRYWRLLLSAEAFARLTGQRGQFDEEIRITLGLEKGFSNRLRIRLDTTWQKEGVVFDAPVEDVFIRVRVFHAL